MKQFEDMIVGKLKDLNEQFKNNNPEVKSPEELLKEVRG